MPHHAGRVLGLLLVLLARSASAQLSVQVGPDNATHPDPKIRLANATGNTVQFTVTNNGTIDAQFTKSCTGIGNVTITTCPLIGLIAAQDFKVVTMTFSVGAAGSGSVQLTVTSTNPTGASAVGKWDETIVSPFAGVNPTGTVVQAAPNQTNRKQVFTVTNFARGAGTHSVAVSCGDTGATGCLLSRTTLVLDSAGVAAASDTTTVTYATGAAGQDGNIAVTSSFAGTNLTPAVLSINIPNAAVTPKGQALGTTTGQTGVITPFQVENTGTLAVIYALSLPTCSPATNCRFQSNGLTTLSLLSSRVRRTRRPSMSCSTPRRRALVLSHCGPPFRG